MAAAIDEGKVYALGNREYVRNWKQLQRVFTILIYILLEGLWAELMEYSEGNG